MVLFSTNKGNRRQRGKWLVLKTISKQHFVGFLMHQIPNSKLHGDQAQFTQAAILGGHL